MKRQYMKPAAREVKLQHRHHILDASIPVTRVQRLNNSANPENFKWKDGGFDGDDQDY